MHKYDGQCQFKFEVMGVEIDLISHVWQLILSSIPIKGWIINPYKYDLLNNWFEVMWFPIHATEGIYADEMSCGAGIIIE